MKGEETQFICKDYIDVDASIVKDHMNLIGMFYEKRVQLITKYDFEFSIEVIEANISRLVNQLWKLIPMRENNEDWMKQLDNVLLEIVGLGKIFYTKPQFLQLLSKLEGLKNSNIEFKQYRKIIFECINILDNIKYE